MTVQEFKLNRHTLCHLLIIFVIGLVVFLPCLKNNFVNWDDLTILNYAQKIHTDPFQTLKKIFSQTVISTYIPLTVLSLGIENILFGQNPFYYHLDNLILHLINSWLVYVLCLRLNLNPRLSLLTTIIFCIHPTKVEPVCWTTARKDVLYAFFYLFSIQAYLSFLNSKLKKHYILSLFFGLLSMLSKPMAISLPIILLLFDWFFGVKNIREVLLNKIPYAIYLIPLAIFTHSHAYSTVAVSSNIFEASLICIWSFSFYIYHFFIPYPLLALYKTPEPIKLLNPVYLGSIFLFISFIYLFLKTQKQKLIRFALLFFIGSMFYLFRFNKMENMTVVGDRFMYLSSLSFCLIVAFGIQYLLDHSRLLSKYLVYACIAMMFSGIGFLSFQQTKMWRDSLSLWSHNLSFTPNNALAYELRGAQYAELGKYEEAIRDLKQAIHLNHNLNTSFLNLATVEYLNGEFSSALIHINQAIQIDPQDGINYYTKGLIYRSLNQPDLAILNFSECLSYLGDHAESYFSRGNLYVDKMEFTNALNDFNRAIQLKPEYIEAYNSRGNLYFNLKQTQLALSDYKQAISINPKYAHAYNNLGYLYSQTEDDDLAIINFSKAIELDSTIPLFYINRSLIYKKTRKYDEALQDLKTADALGAKNLDIHIKELSNFLKN